MLTYSLSLWSQKLVFHSFGCIKQFYEENKELFDYLFFLKLKDEVIIDKIISNRHRWLDRYKPYYYGRETNIDEMTFDEFDKEVSDRYEINASEKQVLEQYLKYFYPMENTKDWYIDKVDFNKKVKFRYNNSAMEYIFKYLWFDIEVWYYSSFQQKKIVTDNYTIYKNWSVEITNKELYKKVFDLVYEYTISRIAKNIEIWDRYIKKV